MKKLRLLAILGVCILATGCSTNKKTEETNSPTEITSTETTTQSETTVSTESAAATEINSETLLQEKSDNQRIEEALSGLIKDEYPGLEMTAAVLERKAILPGSTIPVTVTIKNNGDQSITYSHGSSSYERPSALLYNMDGLAMIAPADQLGIATMDMKIGTLEPGDTLEYVIYIRAIEPNPDFEQYTRDWYEKNETYIGDIEWETLQEEYPDLNVAAAGQYEGQVYFTYMLTGESPEMAFLSEASGYAQADFTISITD